ncbi:MAG: aldo/keto reductase [Thermoplasmata archaeon]
MEFKKVKDLKISVLGQGTWQGSMKGWGKDYSEKDFIESVKKSIELGVNFFDTAEIYGNGYSEKLLGKAISGYNREDLIIATKLAPFNIENWEKHLDRSLKNLNTKYIDIYQLHWPTPFYINFNKYLKEMENAIKNGKIRYIGVSNFYLKDIEKLEVDIISNQIKYNILKKQLNDNEIEILNKKNILVIGYSPLEMGLLSGKYNINEKPKGYLRKRIPYLKGENFRKFNEILTFLKDLSNKYDYSLTQISLKYCILKNVVPIYGSKNGKQSEDNALSINVPLKPEDINKIDELVYSMHLKNLEEDWSKLARNLPLFIQKLTLKYFI